MEYVARKSNLVVPEGFVELDREEMTYVDGGGYLAHINQETVNSIIVATLCTVNYYSVGVVASAITSAATYFAGILCSIPVLGPIIAAGVATWIVGHAWDIAEAFSTSLYYYKGVDIYLEWRWLVVPTFDFVATK